VELYADATTVCTAPVLQLYTTAAEQLTVVELGDAGANSARPGQVQLCQQRIILLLNVLQGINMTSLREIKLLKEIHSPYIVELLDVFPHKRKVTMV